MIFKLNPNAKPFVPSIDSIDSNNSMTQIPDLIPLSRDYLREDELFDVLSQIKFNHATFELSLKNNFAVLSHAMMDDRLFPQTMSIFDIVRDYFGDVVIIADNQSMFVPVSQRPLCNINIH